MKKYFPHISKFLITATFVLALSGIFLPETAHAAECGWTEFGCQMMERVLPGVANMVLKLTSLLTGLAAIILNGVIFHTVVNVSKNYAEIDSISTTWKVVRDIANMGFIFVLLYAAIKTIIGAGGDDKKLIVNVVVVAILINFSLFFTRVVIDISNILALTFYDAIAPNALNIEANWTNQAGLSNAFMQHLNLQTLWQAPDLNPATIITVGVMGSIMLIIAAFVFFAVSLLFIIRYVVLILVLVLSPIAFVAYILPSGTGIDKYRKQWVDALIGQSFFAPIYFMLTWVTLNILSGITKSFGQSSSVIDSKNASVGLGGIGSVIGGTLNSGAFVMIINFIIVIVLLITSLIVAKSWADRAGGGINKLTSWATGAAGGAAMGGLGWAGRSTVGRFGDARANNQDLKDRAAAGSKWAQFQLYGARKTAGSSFDFRATKAGGASVGSMAGKAGGKDGFAGFKKKKAEEEEKYAKSLGPGDEVTNLAERDLEKFKAGNKDIRAIIEKEMMEKRKQHETELNKLNADRSKAGARGASPAELSVIDNKIKGARIKLGKTVNVETYAQARVDELKGVKANDLKKREEEQIKNNAVVKNAQRLEELSKKAEKDLTTNDPILKKEAELAETVKKKEEEVKNTTIPELKAQRTQELNSVKLELEQATKASGERRKEVEARIGISKEMVESVKESAEKEKEKIKAQYQRDESGNIQEVKGAGDRRKNAYAESVENSIMAAVRGYNTAAAAQIRKGKSKEKKLAEAYRDIAGDEEKAEDKAEDKKEDKPAEGGGDSEKKEAA